MRNWGKKDRSARGKGHIAILDDEEAIVFSLTRLVRSFGYSAAGFTNARDAAIGMGHCTPELLISDIAMPGISGIEFAMEITERFPQCKVLLFSGRMDAHELVEDMARHGYSFAVAMKPLHPEELMRRVRQLLNPAPAGEPSGGLRPPFGFSPPLRGV